ncbi:hypothetical protein AB0I82_35840 [Streptomyces sp. NPDC050315]|uniref:hypothetical protein n=1 Tax=Streptomyces sp. NPDC050315 TaxID=3155039 RepID=UPI003447E049
MTTREELHRLVDGLPLETLDNAATALRQCFAVIGEPPFPRSMGMLSEAPEDLATHVDDYLAEGFGQ